jgi:hypothetical protein
VRKKKAWRGEELLEDSGEYIKDWWGSVKDLPAPRLSMHDGNPLNYAGGWKENMSTSFVRNRKGFGSF